VVPRSEDIFTVQITDDSVGEADEYFEVFFNVERNGYAFPGVARITIIDDDREPGEGISH